MTQLCPVCGQRVELVLVSRGRTAKTEVKIRVFDDHEVEVVAEGRTVGTQACTFSGLGGLPPARWPKVRS